MPPRRTYRFLLRLEINNHFPNLHPSAVRVVTVERSGELIGNVWRQLFAIFRGMLAEVQQARLRAKDATEPMPRQKRRYD